MKFKKLLTQRISLILRNEIYKFFLMIIFLSVQSNANEVSPMQITQEIKASRSNGTAHVIVNLIFKNTSKSDIKIAKFLIGENDAPTNSFFSIFCNGQKIQYVGMMMKRSKPPENGFILIPPNQEVRGVFDISESYKWFSANSEYSIEYESNNHFSESKIKLKSNMVKFRF